MINVHSQLFSAVINLSCQSVVYAHIDCCLQLSNNILLGQFAEICELTCTFMFKLCGHWHTYKICTCSKSRLHSVFV